MNDEKILRYFNIDVKKRFDSFFILLLAGMDLGISGLYIFMMLLKIIPVTTTFVFIGICGIVFDVSIIIFSKFIKNPTMEYPMLFFLSLSAMIKSIINTCFAYHAELSLKGISVGVEYLAIPITVILFAIIILREKIIGLSLLKNHTAEQAQEILSNRKMNKWIFPISVFPGGILFLYRLLRNRIDLSITFFCWGLASVFLFFVLITGYNLSTAIYYRLFQIYKRNQID